jgi:2-dehydro-3-deoxyglucarate aldolase/4-hydroxy-2-oxoheptanedioate aldolase
MRSSLYLPDRGIRSLPRENILPQLLLAFWLESDTHKACEIARLASYDSVIFDMEHGTIAETALDRLVPFCNGLGFVTYVRVREANQARIQIALDSGAKGVILPQIRDAAQARKCAPASKFPPRGMRGMGLSRIQNYGSADDRWVATQNSDTQCYVMIETEGALEECEAIAQLDCVDGLFIGPSDLSLNRGRGVFSCKAADVADMERIASAAKAAGKLWGLAAGHAAYRAKAVAQKPDLLAVADDLTALRLGFEAQAAG